MPEEDASLGAAGGEVDTVVGDGEAREVLRCVVNPRGVLGGGRGTGGTV